MKITVTYLTCGCVVLASGDNAGTDGPCRRCGYSDPSVVISETRVIKEPAP